jgi:prepilin-type N-terminal cleavage/methylation domain-containing protein
MNMFKRLFKKMRGQRGMTLVESLVAIAIMGGVLVVMILAMSGGALAVGENQQEAAAQEIARSQMEYVKSCDYNSVATTYPTVTAPAGYSISVGVTSVPGTNTDIQKVTAGIYRDGSLVMTVSDYKVNR